MRIFKAKLNFLKTNSKSDKINLIEELKIFEKGKFEDIKFDGNLVSRKNNFKLYEEVYLSVPVVFNAVNNIANFAIQSGYELEDSSKELEDFIDKSNFDLIFLNILKQTLIYGNCYCELVKNKLGEIIKLNLLPPDTMYIKINENQEVIGYVQKFDLREEINFPKEEIVHFKWNDSTSPFYGVSELKSVLGTITRLLQYQQDMGEIIHRYAQPIIHWKVGSPEEPATQGQINDFNSLLGNRVVGEDLVTSDAVEGVPVTANLKMIQPDFMIKSLENQLIAGLGVPEIFIRGGESSNKATADVEMEAFDRKVKAVRMAVSFKIEDELFSLFGKAKFNWNELSVTSQAEKANILQLYVNSGIPLKVALQMTGMGAWVNDVEESEKKDPQNKDSLPIPNKPQDGQRMQLPTKEGIREEDFATQADWIEAYVKSKQVAK